MDKKRLVRGIMRLLCAFIDYVLVMFPVQFVMLYVMQIELSSVDFLFRLLLAVYGLLMVEYNKARRWGRCLTAQSHGQDWRETSGALRRPAGACEVHVPHPHRGWAAGLISTVMLLLKGTTLHDMAGNTKVIFRWEEEDLEDAEEAGS